MNYNFFRHHLNTYIYGIEEAISDEEEFQWSSDDDEEAEESEWSSDYEEDRGVVVNGDMAKEFYHGDITILGFHPFKEIIFLMLVGLKTTVAYNYNSCKAEVLGNVWPTCYDEYFVSVPNESRTIEGFPYVPCWLEEFPRNTKSRRSY
jgi:hypothetical protein